MGAHYEVRGNVGYVTLDNPPVNAITAKMRGELLSAVGRAEEDGVERVIVTGKGRAFAAGADVREFDSEPVEPHLPDVLNRIETSAVPWIAAVVGPALGGGCELLLACRYRVVDPDAQLGFPETTLGIVPGAGGTQRLPRLVGLANALKIIPLGKPISGSEARQIGLVDHLSSDPVGFAEMLNSEWLGMAVPVGELNTGELASVEFDAVRATVQHKMPGQKAPLVAINLLDASQSLSLDEGLQLERQAFLDLRQSEESRALRHIFFAERSAKAPSWLTAKPVDVKSAAVIGGGTMGASIAVALLQSGLSVVLLETDPSAVLRGMDNVQSIVGATLTRGLIDEATAKDNMDRLSGSDDYQVAKDVDLVIEAAFENMDVKRAIFARMQDVVGPHAVFATNTSYLDIDQMALALRDPSRLVGLHFFAPAHVMKLLEVVGGNRSSQAAVATGFALAKRLRKFPVLAGVCDGFIGNRILAKYREAADTLLLEGAIPWDIDDAMVEFGYAMGPYEAQDLSGLDIAYANRRRQDGFRDPARRYVKISDRMVEEGRLGRKAGVGWYRYPGGKGRVIDPLVEDLIREESHFAKVDRREFSADEIRHRLLHAMINEAADILREGIAAKPSDIDVVTVNGYGFPRRRGGLMHFAESLGSQLLQANLEALAKEDPEFWRPSEVIRDSAVHGLTLAQWSQEKREGNAP